MSFMDKISKCSRGAQRFWFGDLRIASLLFADDMVLLVSHLDVNCSSGDIQLSLEQFASKCEAMGMRVNASKSETIVFKSEKGRIPSLGWE